MQDRGGSLDAGPCTHPYLDTAEIRGVTGDWVHEGQKRNPLGRDVWE
jgi:hypothetical protein